MICHHVTRGRQKTVRIHTNWNNDPLPSRRELMPVGSLDGDRCSFQHFRGAHFAHFSQFKITEFKCTLYWKNSPLNLWQARAKVEQQYFLNKKRPFTHFEITALCKCINIVLSPSIFCWFQIYQFSKSLKNKLSSGEKHLKWTKGNVLFSLYLVWYLSPENLCVMSYFGSDWIKLKLSLKLP